MYFKNIPRILYSLDSNRTTFLATDIFRRVKSDYQNIQNSLAYDEYDIKEDETPEILADQIYNNPQLHWVILIVNEIIDPRWDWPLDVITLESYIDEKYGDTKNNVRYYVNNDGDVVHSSYAGVKTPVTNYNYEVELNESKRRIRILKPQFVPVFITSFMEKMNNG